MEKKSKDVNDRKNIDLKIAISGLHGMKQIHRVTKNLSSSIFSEFSMTSTINE